MAEARVQIKDWKVFPNLKLSPFIAIGVSVALVLFILYFFLPVLSLRFVVWIVPLVLCLVPLLAIRRIYKVVLVTILVLVAWRVLFPFFSQGMFHPGGYRELLGKVEQTEFSELVSPVDLNQGR